MTPKAAWQEKVAEWRAKPRLFVREALRAVPEEWQEQDVLIPLEQGKRFIAIRAGHGVGKTTLEAWCVLWFLLFFRPCKIPVTANSQDQLKDVVWAEIAKWHDRLPPFLKDMIEISAERVVIRANPEGAFAVARTARPERPEALQGFHSDNLLFIIEEASGIPDVIFETAGGALTGKNAYVIMAGNPTRLSGYFHKAFHQGRDLWHCVHVPCSRSSRVEPGYAAKVAAEYGRDSNVYRVRVEGNFPTSEAASVIPLELVEAARGRDVRPLAYWPLWGVDVGRFGDDDSALAKRAANKLLEPPKSWHGLDTVQLAGRIKAEVDATPTDWWPKEILVDVIGIGAGVVDHLVRVARLPSAYGIQVRGVNVAERSPDDDCNRLRDWLWFRGRKWFEQGDCVIPATGCERLVGELTSVTYDFTVNGKRLVESKSDAKKRGVPSPNEADAFLLTFAGTPTPRRKDERRWESDAGGSGWAG